MFLVKNLYFLAPVNNSNNSSISTNVNNNVNNIVNNSVTKFFLCFCSVYPFCSFVFWSGRVQFLFDIRPLILITVTASILMIDI